MSAIASLDFFRRSFEQEPEAIASAPGRVNLIGEHIDYNGGPVLPIAINSRIFAAACRTDGRLTRVRSSTHPGEGSFDPCAAAPAEKWWDYIAGVLGELARAVKRLPAMNIALWSDLPAGAGLSSSAALEVATARAAVQLTGDAFDSASLALLCREAEQNFVGVKCGIMDQFASSLGESGHALSLDCETLDYHHVPFGDSVLVFDTAVPRSLVGSVFNIRKAECDAALARLRVRNPELTSLAAATSAQVDDASLPEPLARRARHVVYETERVRQAVAALLSAGTIPGELLLASHASLRDNYECSSPGLDWFVERATQEASVRGARLTGAGWGGCGIALGDAPALAEVAPRIAADYERHFGRTPRYWITAASDGARLERCA